MLQNARPGGLWLLPPLTALLVLGAADGGADLPKAVLSLKPPWFNVLRDDHVTLTCRGPHGPGNSSTQWLHNGSPVPTQVQPSYHLQVNTSDSGDYRCRTGQTSLSDPVHLDVTSDWVLLQALRLVFRAGEPIALRCHSWKDRPLRKIIFYHNGTPTKFSYNSTFLIPRAGASHGGRYHCTGFLGHLRHTSQPLNVTVQGLAVPDFSPVSPPWPQVAFCLLMGLLFAADTGLYLSVRRQLRSSARVWKDNKVVWSKLPQDK